jgi:hypothetical protein
MNYLKTINKKKIAFIGIICWSGLGFFRGINYYNYNLKTYYNSEPYLYTHSYLSGLLGIFIYINPVLLPFTLYKEIYRIEINIRNIKIEKENKYYDLL